MNYLIVAGGRDFKDWCRFYGAFNAWFDEHDPSYQNTVILSGMADGADTMGYLTAQDRGIPYMEYPAEWERYGKRLAGKLRNQKMADDATHLLAFWDGRSTGTKDMITRAKYMRLHTTVVRYDERVEVKRKTLW